MRLLQLAGASVVLALCGACASVGGLRTEPLNRGVSRDFASDYATVVSAARTAIISAGLAVDSFDQLNDATTVIIAKKAISKFSWGELVRVVVVSAGPDKSSVRVLTKRRLATNVTAKGDYSVNIFENMALALK